MGGERSEPPLVRGPVGHPAVAFGPEAPILRVEPLPLRMQPVEGGPAGTGGAAHRRPAAIPAVGAEPRVLPLGLRVEAVDSRALLRDALG